MKILKIHRCCQARADCWCEVLDIVHNILYLDSSVIIAGGRVKVETDVTPNA